MAEDRSYVDANTRERERIYIDCAKCSATKGKAGNESNNDGIHWSRRSSGESIAGERHNGTGILNFGAHAEYELSTLKIKYTRLL